MHKYVPVATRFTYRVDSVVYRVITKWSSLCRQNQNEGGRENKFNT